MAGVSGRAVRIELLVLLGFLGLATRTLGAGVGDLGVFIWLLRWTPFAAAAGGLVYGFSPAMLGHSHHLNLILVFLLPWLLVLVDEIVVRQRQSPVWVGVALGVIAAAQALIGEELLAASVLLGGLLLVVLVAMRPRSVPGRVRYAITEGVRGSSDLLAVVTPRCSAALPSAGAGVEMWGDTTVVPRPRDLTATRPPRCFSCESLPFSRPGYGVR